MARKLKITVYVTNDETGETEILVAGSTPTAAQAKQISNPQVWEDDTSGDEIPASEQTPVTAPNDLGGTSGAEASATGYDPSANVRDVKAWVGDDPSKAQEALDAERAKGDDARTTLVAHLEGIVGAADAAKTQDLPADQQTPVTAPNDLGGTSGGSPVDDAGAAGSPPATA